MTTRASDIPRTERWWTRLRRRVDNLLSDPASILAMIVVIGVLTGYHYVSMFGWRPPNDVAKWGQFGDFVGGTFNPLIGFFTLVALIVTVQQNNRIARSAIEQAAAASAERAVASSHEALLSAMSGFKAAVAQLNVAGNDRRKWVSAARLLAIAQKLRAAITEQSHLHMLDIIVEQERQVVAHLLGYGSESRTASFYYGAPLTPDGHAPDPIDDAARHSTSNGNQLSVPEEALYEFWAFAQFAEDHRASLPGADISWPPVDAPNRSMWPGLFEYVAHRAEWKSVDGMLVKRSASA